MGSFFLTIHHRLPICPGAMIEAFIDSAASWVIDRSNRPPFLPFRCRRFLPFICHARINPCAQHPWGVVHRHRPLVYVRLTVGNKMSQDLIAPDRSSSVYGVTWLQVYSYYSIHCSRDRWPLKSFVRASTCCVPYSGS